MKRFKPPKQLKIGNNQWNVEPIYGCTYYPSKEIVIACNLKGKDLEDTYLHELLHACFHEADIKLQHKQEEQIISALTPVLLEVLRQCRWTNE